MFVVITAANLFTAIATSFLPGLRQGRLVARNVMGGYEHNFYDFLETVASANTVVVDGQNADMTQASSPHAGGLTLLWQERSAHERRGASTRGGVPAARL